MAQLLRQRNVDRSFERLYRAHRGDVYRYSLALTGNPSDAEDVAQTTFMNAYRALEAGQRPVQPRNWLIAIAQNVCRQRFRQAARRPAEVLLDEDLVEALVPDDSAPTAADIQRALQQLPTTQREALVMRELEGRSYTDISAALGLTLPAVESAIFRARRALREQIESSLSCNDAEAAISLQLDGRLRRSDRGALRGHLRACSECRSLARRHRAQRQGWRAFAALPLPPSLGSLLGGSSAGIGAGAALKIAAVTTAVVAGGGTYAVIQHETNHVPHGLQPAVHLPEAHQVRVDVVARAATPHNHARAAGVKPARHAAKHVHSAGTAPIGAEARKAIRGGPAGRAHDSAQVSQPAPPVHAIHAMGSTHSVRLVYPTRAHSTSGSAHAKQAMPQKAEHPVVLETVPAAAETAATSGPSSHADENAARSGHP